MAGQWSAKPTEMKDRKMLQMKKAIKEKIFT